MIDIKKVLDSKNCGTETSFKITPVEENKQDCFEKLLMKSEVFTEMRRVVKKLFELAFMDDRSRTKKRLKANYKKNGITLGLLDDIKHWKDKKWEARKKQIKQSTK